MEIDRSQIKTHSGFTLIELLIVVSIIGVLASIAIPVYRNYITISKQKSAEAVLEQLPLLLEAYRAENGSFPPNGTTTYSESSNGTIASQTIRTTAGLTGFTPRTGTTTGAISFSYSLTIAGSGATGESATFTATGVRKGLGISANGSYQ